ncbi:MAG TPA: RDD family protein [Vicinamibacteria bacterium]
MTDPLRDIPGMRKRERTWKDEVRERVRERRMQRGAAAELPLFPDAEPAEPEPPPPSLEMETEAEVESAAPVAVEAEPPLIEDVFDLPLRATETPARAPVAVPETPRHFDMQIGEPADAGLEAAGRGPRLDVWLDDAVTKPPGPVERPAGYFERAQAAAVDLVLLLGVWSVVLYFASRTAHVSLLGLKPAWPYLAGYLAFLGLVYACYFTGTTGQTVGKIAGGLRVLHASGRPPGYSRAFARAALGVLGVALALVGLAPMLVDPARRALHDRLLRTRVVKVA